MIRAAPVQSLLDRGNLVQHVDAVPIRLHHPGHALDLARGLRQEKQHIGSPFESIMSVQRSHTRSCGR